MIPLRNRLLSVSFLAVGLCLSSLGAYFYFAPQPGPALEAAETDLELSDCVPGEKRDVVLRLENHSREPIRVLGMGFC